MSTRAERPRRPDDRNHHLDDQSAERTQPVERVEPDGRDDTTRQAQPTEPIERTARAEPVERDEPTRHDRYSEPEERTQPDASPERARRDEPAHDFFATDDDGAPRHESKLDPREVAAAQASEFGGIKAGSAFFGWITANAMILVLGAIASVIALIVGLPTNSTVDSVRNDMSSTSAIVGIIVLAVITFVGYYCGGYVAARMARFSGAKQGFAVWLWAALFAGIIALVTAIIGGQNDLPGRVRDQVGSLPTAGDTITTASIVTLAAIAVISLIGAIVGGLAGMPYHRRIDAATLDLDLTTSRG